MALPKYISTGTASVANGATAVTGTGTTWNGVVKADDRFTVQGLSVRIASVTDDTHLTLAEAWPGTALTDDAYEIAITYDGPEFQLRTRELLEELATVTANGRGLLYTFSDGTSDADPGDGKFAFNHATIGSATGCYIDNLDGNGAPVSAVIDTWDDSGSTDGRGQLWVRSIATPSTFHAVDVTGSVVDGTGYRKLTHDYIGGAGTLAVGDEIMVIFLPLGQGVQGEPGTDGTNGTNGTDGVDGVDGTGMFSRVRFVDTTDSDPATSGYGAGAAIDGGTTVTNDLILRASTGHPERNGIWVVPASGAAARDGSFDTYDEHPGVYVSVMEGTSYADTLWRCTSNKGGTLGTTAITFVNSAPGAKGGDVASAATITLSANYHHVTGTTTITDIDFSYPADGRYAWLIFDGALTLTHNSTTLKLPGGANITTAAGDRALFIQDSSDNVICLDYIPAAVPPITSGTWTPSLGGTATYTARSGRWTRIGTKVLIEGTIKVNAIGTGSSSAISGLPFTSDASEPLGTISVGYASDMAVSLTFLTGNVVAGGTTIVMRGTTGSTANITTVGPFGNSAVVHFTGQYTAA